MLEPGDIRIGIVGSGRIARRFVAESTAVAGLCATCVYNPHRAGADAFAAEAGVSRVAESCEELFDACDAVYVASPHETHFAYARDALLAGRHVLCEKPLALSADEARELYALACERGLVLIEAIKTAFCPGYLRLVELVRDGAIGDVCDVESCFTRLTPRGCRERDDRRFGGSMLELGSYSLLPIVQLLGSDYCDVRFETLAGDDGIDVYTKASLRYPDALALAKTGLAVKSEGQLVVAGTQGYILAPSPWWMTRRFEVHREDPEHTDVYEFEFSGDGLRYEMAAFVAAIHGELDAREMLSVGESAAVAGVLERFLAEQGRA